MALSLPLVPLTRSTPRVARPLPSSRGHADIPPMYPRIFFLPLLGFLIAGIFGRKIGARPSELVTTAFLGVAALLSWVAFFRVGFGDGGTRVQVANWMVSGDLSVAWAP